MSSGTQKSDDVYSFAQKSGFSADQIAWAVDRGSKKGLIERAPRQGNSDGHEQLRVTSAGVYTARFLASMFAYIDAVVVDTPILDPSFRNRVTDAQTISERLRRAELFRLYLDRHWRALEDILDNPSFNWPEHSDRLRLQVQAITQRTRP